MSVCKTLPFVDGETQSVIILATERVSQVTDNSVQSRSVCMRVSILWCAVLGIGT